MLTQSMHDPDLSNHPTLLELTSPNRSPWDQEGTEHAKENAEWVARLARRIIQVRPEIEAGPARDLAQELSLDDALRARTPERVAEDMTADTRTLGLFD